MDERAAHGQQQLGRFLAAYRGQLPRAEAARRAGVSEARWSEVETGSATGEVSAHTVAAMCVAVGADIATGLQLAGYDPREYEYLLATPPGMMRPRPPLSPWIAIHRAIVDAVAGPGPDPRPRIASIYEDVATENRRLADAITRTPPDGRAEYWAGYASALRAIADEQQCMVDVETRSPTDPGSGP